MARVLIVGGNGFIGPRVAHALGRLGHEALTVARQGGDRVADRNDPGSIARLVRDECCNVLIDLIAYDLTSTKALHDAVTGLIGRYVLVSSADVYRNYGGLHRRESAPPTLELLHEDAPKRASRLPYRQDAPRHLSAPDAWMDTYDKIPIEDVFVGAGATIVRLPMVFGPGDRHRRFGWITAPMQAGANTIRAPTRWLDWVTTYGHVDDVAHALALSATSPAAAGKTYNCGEAPVAHAAWIARFAALTSWSGEIVADEESPLAQAISQMDLSFPLGLCTHRIREDLGFSEQIPPDEALKSVL